MFSRSDRSFPNKLSLIVFVSVFFSIRTFVLAGDTVIESYVSTELTGLQFHGVFPGGQFGSSIEQADINGDGMTDMFVSSPFTSVFKNQWNGAITIVFGSATAVNHTIHMYGENSGDQLGTSLAGGDFNGDGIDDMVFGAYNYSQNETRPGGVYLMYGWVDNDVDMSSHESDFVFNKADSLLVGNEDASRFGMSMLSIDVNKDGFDDLVVGAPGTGVYEKKMTGAVYVYYGGAEGIDKNAAFSLYGHAANEKFGSSIEAGDFNGDGSTDLAIGAYAANNGDVKQAGRVYIYDNVISQTETIIKETAYFDGNAEKAWFGFAMASGDANGDNVDDLFISSFPYLGERSDAAGYLYYGSPLFMQDFQADVVVESPDGEPLPGASVLLSDINSDGKDDMVIGAPGINYTRSTSPGDVYIVFSDKEAYKPTYSIQAKAGINIIHGEKADDWFGYGLNSFDFNGDMKMDVVIGSRYSDNKTGVNNGKVFLLLGNNRPFGRVLSLINREGDMVSRAELVKVVFDSFNLRDRKAGFLENCYAYKEFCLFNFVAMSSFNEIQLEPELLLYPDVDVENEYYQYINDATVLGVINGYLDEENSPFRPESPVTRIQALKVILGAADLVPQKYRFEIIAMLGSYENLFSQSSYFDDIDARISEMWWYPRYVNYAVDNGIISDGDFFRPNDNITIEELNDLIINTLPLVK